MNHTTTAVELRVKVRALMLLSSEPLQDPARVRTDRSFAFLYKLTIVTYLGIIFADAQTKWIALVMKNG